MNSTLLDKRQHFPTDEAARPDKVALHHKFPMRGLYDERKRDGFDDSS